MMSSATLRDAVRVGLRFQNLAGSMVRWSSAEEAGGLVVTAALQEPASAVGTFLIEEGFANITRMARDVAGLAGPQLVELAHAAGSDPAVYRDYFGNAVRFAAARNAWHVPLASAHAALASADAWTHRETVALLETQTDSIIERQELVAVLATQIEDALPDAPARGARTCTRDERADTPATADRGGASYSGVLDDVRKRLAAELFASRADDSRDRVPPRLRRRPLAAAQHAAVVRRLSRGTARRGAPPADRSLTAR
jgi:hypothetical protein